MPWRTKEKQEKSPVKLLVWTALLGLLFGLIGLTQLPEDLLRIARNKLHQHQASGEIVLVTIDDEALQSVGRWPWPRRYHATIVDKLTNAGAKHIYYDVLFDTSSNPQDDQMLANSIAKSGRVTLGVRGHSGPTGSEKTTGSPITLVRQGAKFASISVRYNYQNAVWDVERAGLFEGRLIPSLSAAMAGKSSEGSAFLVDYSLDYKTIPRVSASEILNGKARPETFANKSVLIGTDTKVIGDQFFIPGWGKMGGAYIHVFGAETLKTGAPTYLGWSPAFLLSLMLAAAALRTTGTRQNLLFAAWLTVLLIAPIPLEANRINLDIVPALFVALTIWGWMIWSRYSLGGVTNAVSGLPNLTALQYFRGGRDQALVAARILNYAEVTATLPPEAEKSLVEQIVARLSVGSQDKIVYHGDGGLFAWFEDAPLPFSHHIDALHALFRNPVRVGVLQADLSVAFGVEIGSGRSLANRLASALVAAEEAAHDGFKWKIHDPEKLNDASWKLSILSRLDQAIDDGEVWVAYQPKLDLKSRQIIGAEALARWTHPEKGPIAASEFIAAAEQHGRIGKLTDFVLDRAIASAAAIHATGREFHIAVNLSARLLNDRDLKSRLAETLLKHLLEPQFLTLELTETSAISSVEALETLTELRALGVEISIDDYGTGMSTLDYLKKVPAREIKIDQSFIRGLAESRSDRVMVQSTIALAHSLKRSVVAEGVETKEVLELLADLKCDVAQGFIIGRPMSFDSLRRRLIVEQRRSVA